MKYAICFFPIVGILCGACIFVWNMLCKAVGMSDFIFAAVAVCIPILITGGIHLDGYMDTIDALSSHRSSERKLEILKDPNCGAFAVIYCVVYILINLSLFYELYRLDCIAAICPIFVLSRGLSALCAVNMQNARGTGMLCAYTKNTERKTANIAMISVLAVATVMLAVISPLSGGSAVCFSIITVLVYIKTAKKQFGGVTGDTAGFFLQICELSAMAGALIGALLV